MIEQDEIFFKIKGGWFTPRAINWVETYKHNEKMVVVSLYNKDRPIVLNEADSAYLMKYVDAHVWLDENESDESESGFTLEEDQQERVKDAI